MNNNLTLEHILSFIDFSSYFTMRTVCARWYHILKNNENKKLQLFSVRVNDPIYEKLYHHILPNGKFHEKLYHHILPNGKFHGPRVWMSSKYGYIFHVLRYVEYVHGLKHGTGIVQHYYSGDQLDSNNMTIAVTNGLNHEIKTNWIGINLESRCTYVHGLKHGLEENWYSTGQIESYQHYSYGIERGKYKSWYPRGNKRSKAFYMGDGAHKVYISWYETGQFRAIMNYRYGKLHGLSEFWSQYAGIYKFHIFDNGIRT